MEEGRRQNGLIDHDLGEEKEESRCSERPRSRECRSVTYSLLTLCHCEGEEAEEDAHPADNGEWFE